MVLIRFRRFGVFFIASRAIRELPVGMWSSTLCSRLTPDAGRRGDMAFPVHAMSVIRYNGYEGTISVNAATRLPGPGSGLSS